MTFIQDLKYFSRGLFRDPSYALVAILVVAMGIFSSTVIFSFVNGLLLRPLPFEAPGRLLFVSQTSPDQGRFGLSLPDFEDWRRVTTVFDEMAAYDDSAAIAVTRHWAERIEGSEVTAEFFFILGVEAAIGRTFRIDEDRPGAEQVAVLGHAFWKRAIGSDPDVIGRTVRLSGADRRVVGVMPEGFDYPESSEFWIPARPIADFSDRENYELKVIARLKEGIGAEEAQAEAETMARRLADAYPSTKRGLGMVVSPLREELVPPMVSLSALALLGAVIFLLSLACANIASLHIVKALSRRREFAIRLSLGAAKSRIIRQLLTESLLLGTVGAALGLSLAALGRDVLVASLPPDFPSIVSFDLDLRVLGFSIAATALVGTIFGLAPVFLLSWVDPVAALKGTSGPVFAPGRQQRRWHGALMVIEISLAFALTAGAGLMIKALLNLRAVDPGFHVEDILTLTYSLTGAKYSDEKRRFALGQDVLTSVGNLPGVTSVAGSARLPMISTPIERALDVEGFDEPDLPPVVLFNAVTTNYFDTMSIPLIQGRGFDSSDIADGPRTLIVSRSVAQRFWLGKSPIGNRLRLGSFGNRVEVDRESPPYTVVGVVGDVRNNLLESQAPLMVYAPYAQWTPWYLGLVIRSSESPPDLAASIRSRIAAIDPGVPVHRVRTFRDAVSISLWRPRLLSWIFSLFAGLALILASVGIYGVISHGVRGRTHEIGIRVAMGARRQDILRMILKSGLALVTAGVVLGVAGAALLARLLEDLLFGVGADDPTILLFVALIFVVVSFLACYLPARRASQTEFIHTHKIT